MRTAEVVIIGGGVIGASVAYHLAARGLRDVLVLERAAAPGAESTARAPGSDNLHLANGSSGHGVMHAPALGQLLSEIILDGAARTLDVHALRPTRFAEGRPNAGPDLL